jgi:hypothetical protein
MVIADKRTLIPTPPTANGFQGSALEPAELQAPPVVTAPVRSRLSMRSEAEPREQCVPRQSQGTRTIPPRSDRA